MSRYAVRLPAAMSLFAAALIFSAVASAKSQRGPEYFTNAELTAQNGMKYHFYDDLIKNKIVVIEFFYSECTNSCPMETARLAQVQRMLGDRVGKDVFFYSISLDPTTDSPEKMRAYSEKYKVGPGWLFLTGKKADIDLISQRLGMYSDFNVANPSGGHPAAALLGNDATGQWMRNSAFDNPRFLAVMIGDWLNSWKNSTNAGKSYVDAPQIAIKDPGQYIFASTCSACHTIGKGVKIGPDLAGVTTRRDPVWLKRFIATPHELIAAKDPIALELFAKHKQVNMPDLKLNDADVAALVTYLQAEAK